MLTLSQLKQTWTGQRDVIGLYIASFLMSSSGGIYVVAFPFVINHLGGSDKHLGIASALTSVIYIITCLLVGPVIDRKGPKRYSQIGAAGIIVSTAAVTLVVLFYDLGYRSFNPVTFIIIIGMVSGIFLAIFWPPVMGWITIGHEGKQLNRRLGFFNMSWTVGFCASPYIGGLMTEINYVLPIAVAMLLVVFAFVAICFTKPSKPNLCHQSDSSASDSLIDRPHPLLPKFRVLARIALIPIFICMGLARTQVALLFNEPFGFSESQFGIFMTLLWLTSCVLFIVLSKTHAWHYKLRPFIAAQLIMMLGMLMIIKNSSLWVFCFIAVVLGASHALIYVSHQFYAVSGSANRSGPMAIHETLLSIGYVIGFLGGGYLAEYFTRRAIPYWFGFAAVALALVIQMIIWFLPNISCAKTTN